MTKSLQQANIQKKEEILYRSLKWKQEKIDAFLHKNTSNNILCGIQIELDGKILSFKIAQALILKNMEDQQTIYFQNKTIKTLQEKLDKSTKINITALNKIEIQKLVEKEIEEKKLGLTIFMSISQYLSILLSLSCSNCFDLLVSNQKFYITILGFNISCNITCVLCNTSIQYSNEDSGVKYSHLAAGVTLARGINRNSFQTALAVIGVTNQSSK